MIRTLIVIFVTTLSFSAICQSNSTPNNQTSLDNDIIQYQMIESDEIDNHQRTWVKLFESEKISIHFKFENCYSPSRGTNHEKIYFQISNLTDVNLEIEYWMQKWQNELCLNCTQEGTSYITKLVIPANKTITGSCDESSDRLLELFSKMLEQENQAHITKLKLSNFKVHTLN